jgi:hypothetical protein
MRALALTWEDREQRLARLGCRARVAASAGKGLLISGCFPVRSRYNLLYGYLISAGLMLVGAAIEAGYGVKAERVGLESPAAPLSAAG